MSKLKKILLLIPTAFIMLLNCISFTAFADEINYQDYWIDLSEIPELQSREWIFDSTKDSNHNPGFSKYIYAVDTINKSSYDDFISGIDDVFSFKSYYIDLTNVEFESNEYSVVSLNRVPVQQIEFEFCSDGTLYFYPAVTNSYFIRYFPDSGTIQLVPIFDSSGYPLADKSYINTNKYYIHIESNHPDFPVPDFAGGSSGGALNVSVNFDPEMSGDFQRREIINDKIVTIDTLNFSVTNNSKFSIQYLVAIVSQDDFFSLYSDNAISHPNGKVYSGDPTYVYVSDEWCYLPSGTKGITSTYCPSSWHHVDSGDVDNVTVNFNQMKLNIGVIYSVYVYAVKNTQDSVCVIPFNQDSYQYNEDYVLNFSDAQVVYSSQFTCSNPAEFDPNSNSGSYAFDGSDTSFFNRANGYIDENGNVVIDRIDTDSLISGSDSWGSQFDKNAWDVYYDRQNSVSSDLTQLSNNFSSFFRFINKVFGYFPKNFQSVISLGLTSVVVLGIIKVVIK